MGGKKNKYRIKHHISLKENGGEVFVFEWLEKEDVCKKNKTQFQRNTLQYFLKNEVGIDSQIAHYDSGAPYLVHSKKHISISHSGNLFALQISSKDAVGVDVQLFKTGLSRGYSYFVNEQEEKLHELSNLNLHLIWCAKESIYKFKKGEVKLYREDISVVEIKDDFLRVVLKTGKKIKCQFIVQNNYLMVYVSE